MSRLARLYLLAGCAALLTACADKPRVPDWQMNSHDAMERAVAAWLTGDSRIEAVEFARVRMEVTRTGRADLVARAELLRCASRVASLVVEPCAGFEPLRQDAGATERAYADYLAARIAPQDVALLPAAQRAVAAPGAGVEAVRAVADPLGRLVAAGVLFQAGRAGPDVAALAVDTASAQGWRRPLLAWLGVQAERADKVGQLDEAQRVRRRIALVTGTP